MCVISLTRFKEFRKFWTCYFVAPLVTDTDKFWKIRGLIEGFNELCRHIASGVGKTADESMSVIKFRTNPKGDLQHYSYVFRNPEPLGKVMKNMACSRLGNMLYLEIQKRKEVLKTAKCQNVMGGTTACMKRLAIATKGCGQLTSNDT